MRKVKQKTSEIIKFSLSSQVTLLLFGEIIIGLFLTLVTLFFFLKLGDKVIDQEAIFFDSTLTHFIYLFRSPFMTTIMRDITFFGGQILLGSAVIVTILFLLKKHKKDALVFAFILFFGIGLNLLLKDMFQRPRPDIVPLVHETSYSFPSGHAMNSFIFYTCLSFFIFRRFKNKQLKIMLICGSALLIFLIGLSRIYLGVHYPSDVIAGYTAGLCWFVMVLLFDRTLIFFRLFKNRDLEKQY